MTQAESKKIETCDLLIVGGGINGVGIAADAAGRNLSVILCEQGDLASGTSSASSKLIHGGLRYLEQFDFRLVCEALNEREVLLKNAPHLIHGLQFLLPQTPHSRPAWFIALGLFFYDHLARTNSLPRSKKIKFSLDTANPLKPELKIGFTYFDCQADDARLVVTNAKAAQEKGAKILTRTKFISAQRQQDHWLAKLQDVHSNEKFLVTAKVLINAAGPWVDEVAGQISDQPKKQQVNLVKGSHIVVPRLYGGDQAYLLQNPDRRVVFVMPYKDEFTLIGTTEVTFEGDAKDAHISIEEIYYLCSAVNRYFSQTITAENIIWSYAGVRALYGSESDNLRKISRDYHLELSDEEAGAPLLSVLGGKITTYRTLAEQVLIRLKKYFPSMGVAWTAKTPLPGGDLPTASFAEFVVLLQQQYPNLPGDLLQRYAGNYGSLTYKILTTVTTCADLGVDFGSGLYEKEIDYLLDYEWAQTADDILWRRTKLGLLFTERQKRSLEKFIKLRQENYADAKLHTLQPQPN